MASISRRVTAPVARVGGRFISQDSVIFAAVMLAFIVWITTKDELPTYLVFFKPTGAWGPKRVSPSTGQTSTATNPNTGTVVGATPGQPGLNLNNPFAGIPGLGGAFQGLLPGNSNGSGTQQVPGQANPIPWGQIGSSLRGFLQNPFGAASTPSFNGNGI